MLSAYSIAASGTFERDFRKLDKSIQERINKKIRQAAADPEAHCVPLRHLPRDLEAFGSFDVAIIGFFSALITPNTP